MKMICPKANTECLGCNHARPHEKEDTCTHGACKYEGIVSCIKIKEATNVKS